MNIDIKNVCDIEVDGVDPHDYPDFCDAFFYRAYWVDTGLELTDEELDAMADQYPELLNEMAYEYYI